MDLNCPQLYKSEPAPKLAAMVAEMEMLMVATRGRWMVVGMVMLMAGVMGGEPGPIVRVIGQMLAGPEIQVVQRLKVL